MAIAFRAETHISNGSTSATNVPVTVPAGVAAGDLLLLAVGFASSTALATPDEAGWSEVPSSGGSTGTLTQHRIFSRIATASEPATYGITFTVAGVPTAQRYSAAMLAYIDATVGTAAFAATAAASTTHTTGSVTPAAATSWTVTVWTARYSGAPGTWLFWAPDAAETERLDVLGTNSTSNIGLAVDDSAGTVAAVSTSRTATTGVSNTSVQTIITLDVAGPAPQVIIPAGIPSDEAWGTSTILFDHAPIEPSGIPSGEAWGTPTVVLEHPPIQPGGIPSGEAWGTPTLLHEHPTIGPSGIPSEEAWGNPTVVFDHPPIEPSGIPSEEAWGNPTIESSGPAQLIQVPEILSEEAWGTPELIHVAPAFIEPEGIPSQEAWGTPTITHVPPVFVEPAGIPSEEAWGTPTIVTAGPPVVLEPTGIPSGEAWGTPTLDQGPPPAPHVLEPTGIPSAEAWGTPTLVSTPPTLIQPTGIPSGEAWGTPTLTQGSPPVPPGSCDVWPIVVDPTCCPDWADLPIGLKEQTIRLASSTLWALSGRRYGLCQVTVRPCDVFCLSCGANRPAGRELPFQIGGQVYACGCGCASACCPAACVVSLSPLPVYDIVSVRVDGVPVPRSGWKVLNSTYLVRVGGCWPKCQDLSLPDSSPGTWSVTYRRGIPVPADGLWVASMLACEIAKQCAGKKCRLPARVTQLSRDGVSMTMVDKMEFMDKGLTGLPEVDRWLRSVNPHGLSAPPQIWTPDMVDPWIVTG
jgi:hypothetical protein